MVWTSFVFRSTNGCCIRANTFWALNAEQVSAGVKVIGEAGRVGIEPIRPRPKLA